MDDLRATVHLFAFPRSAGLLRKNRDSLGSQHGTACCGRVGNFRVFA